MRYFGNCTGLERNYFFIQYIFYENAIPPKCDGLWSKQDESQERGQK